ncbi:MAG: hypothetical protein HYZ50_09840 [Deltaproteobacteria bacterium]|nr:hypothetical protein [Deltaproteobacteria bacterium]
MSDFKAGVLDWNGRSLRYAEAGAGPAVVIFSTGEGELFDDVAAALAIQRHVIVFDVSDLDAVPTQDCAAHLAQALTRLGVASFSVLGVSRGTTPALAQAIHTPTQVQRLVLISPSLASVQHPELGERLSEIKAPTLVLVGTRDRSGARVAGQTCRERIPASHLLLVYEAGHAIVADRREACLAPINEFLDRGEGFIVFQDSQMIRP